MKLVRRELDFIKLNGCAAKKVAIRRSPSATALDDWKKKLDDAEKTYKRGEVPN